MGYLNLVGSFVYKEPLFRSKLSALANNDAQLKTDSWALNTKTIFFQAAVPVGWTQDVSQNDKCLRIVSGGTGGGSGGTQGLSSTISLAHTHAITSDDGHTHVYAAHTHTYALGTTPIPFPDRSFGNPTHLYIGGGFLQRVASGGSSTFNILVPTFTAPSTITLGSLAAHNHGGTTPSALTDAILAYCDVIIGTKNAVSGTYTDLTAFWHTGDKIDFDAFAEYANNDAYTYGALMPAGSISLFAQASAPTGWTKIGGLDDRFLRIVSGAGGGSGGVQPISSGLVLTHTHVLTATVDHTHSMPAHTHPMTHTVSTGGLTALSDGNATFVQADGSGTLVTSSDSASPSTRTIYKDSTATDGSGNTSAAGGHTHDLPQQLASAFFSYVDVIQCSKDSAGAPYSYTDYTAEFAWKKLVTYQRLNTLAKNDAYIQYHTTPVNTGMLFFMASPPTGWVKNIANNDIGLRIVTGSTGGIVGGGSQGISQTIPLAHAHTIVPAGSHTHIPTHTHAIDTGSHSANAATSTLLYALNQLSSGISGANFKPKSSIENVTDIPTEIIIGTQLLATDPDHSHGGATDSKLSDVNLAYADLIWCTKS